MNTAVFAKSVAMLGSSEDNTALSRALSQLAEVEDRIEQLHQDQASNDFFTFAELLADYIRLLGAVRVWKQTHLLTLKHSFNHGLQWSYGVHWHQFRVESFITNLGRWQGHFFKNSTADACSILSESQR